MIANFLNLCIYISLGAQWHRDIDISHDDDAIAFDRKQAKRKLQDVEAKATHSLTNLYTYTRNGFVGKTVTVF